MIERSGSQRRINTIGFTIVVLNAKDRSLPQFHLLSGTKYFQLG